MVLVGVIDSGGPIEDLNQARAFLPDGTTCPAQPDHLGHGTIVADTIRRACPGAVITHAQVFDDRPVTTALQVAAALRWFALAPEDERVDLVCLSLGLTSDRSPLRAACKLAIEMGILVVAAHPARGLSCYPAAYPGTIAGTGDARCGWDDLSRLGPSLFGAWCNSPEQGNRGMGGASLGAARLAGHLAQDISASGRPGSPVAAIERLAMRVRYRGPEQRRPEAADERCSAH